LADFIPPAGLKPILWPVSVRNRAMPAGHHQRNRQRRIDAFLAGRCLDEVRPSLHGDHRGLVDIAQRLQLASGQDGFHVGRPTGLAHGRHLVIKRLQSPFSTCARWMTMSISLAPSSTA
jgi:hypothetical protein